MHIDLIDPADVTSVAKVVRLWQTAYEVDFPEDPPFCPRWERGRIEHPVPDEQMEFWVAREGASLLGVLDVGLPTLDNVTTALVDVVVLPQARRRGVATALYAKARERVTALGRKLVIGFTRATGAGEGFARAIGARPGLIEVRRRLTIQPDSPALWARLLVDAQARARGYTVIRWSDDVPEECLDGIAYLNGRMSTDAPLGDLDWAPETHDADRVRGRAAAYAARGRRSYGCAVVHEGTGEVAGFTELAFEPCNDAHAWQWATIVDPAHRGHRLGTVLKIENLRWALEHEPGLGMVSTYNAASNDHMIAINEAMGFRPFDTWCDWQLRLDA